MKPTKNRIFCKDCNKLKIFFETENKANLFIKFNANEIEENSGYKPERSYFCSYCCGWHVTSKREAYNIKSKTDVILSKYNEDLEKKKQILEKRIVLSNINQKIYKEILEILESQVLQIEKFEIKTNKYNESLENLIVNLEKANNLKSYSFKGSNARIRKLNLIISNIIENPLK